MAKSSRRLYPLLFCCIIAAFFFGCGGGGSGGSSSGGGATPAKSLNWNPPLSYQDGSPLNPAADLDRFEIYIKENSNFTDTDDEMAALSAIDKANGLVCTSFNLSNLAPFLSKGVVYHVSIRAVANNGLKSNFSASASFSF
jgi:hypothetical protein